MPFDYFLRRYDAALLPLRFCRQRLARHLPRCPILFSMPCRFIFADLPRYQRLTLPLRCHHAAFAISIFLIFCLRDCLMPTLRRRRADCSSFIALYPLLMTRMPPPRCRDAQRRRRCRRYAAHARAIAPFLRCRRRFFDAIFAAGDSRRPLTAIRRSDFVAAC